MSAWSLARAARRRGLFAVLALLSATSAWADNPVERALLWQVQQPQATAVSHLLATIHSDDPRVLSLPPAVTEAFSTAKRYCMELLLTPATRSELQQRMLLPEHQSLAELLPNQTWLAARSALEQSGVPAALAIRLRPWAVFLTLSMPPPKSGLVLDLYLSRQAQQRGLPVCGLETLDSQLGVFEKLPDSRQVYLVQEALKLEDQRAAYFEQLLQAYLARDLAALQALAEADLKLGDENFNRELMAELLEKRNQRMLVRLLAELERGGAFIAVGALHFPGPNGLLQLLREQGYRLTPVY